MMKTHMEAWTPIIPVLVGRRAKTTPLITEGMKSATPRENRFQY
jgi:hypothetical protein